MKKRFLVFVILVCIAILTFADSSISQGDTGCCTNPNVGVPDVINGWCRDGLYTAEECCDGAPSCEYFSPGACNTFDRCSIPGCCVAPSQCQTDTVEANCPGTTSRFEAGKDCDTEVPDCFEGCCGCVKADQTFCYSRTTQFACFNDANRCEGVDPTYVNFSIGILDCPINCVAPSLTGCTISGNVNYKVNTSGVPGAIVTGPETAEADTNGHYELDNMPSGTYVLSASTADEMYTGSVLVECIPGTVITADINVTLIAPAIIEGTVTNQETALGVEGAVVIANYAGKQATAATDGNGNYVLRIFDIEAAPPTNILLTAAKSGFNTSNKTTTLSKDEIKSVNFVLSPKVIVTLSGSVTYDVPPPTGVYAFIDIISPAYAADSKQVSQFGAFSFSVESDTRYELMAYLGGYTSAHLNVTVGDVDYPIQEDILLIKTDTCDDGVTEYDVCNYARGEWCSDGTGQAASAGIPAGEWGKCFGQDGINGTNDDCCPAGTFCQENGFCIPVIGGGCDADCTYRIDNVCHKSCSNVTTADGGKCEFNNTATMDFCDGKSLGFHAYNSTHGIQCCEGSIKSLFERETVCDDGIDDDGDGNTDCLDSDCDRKSCFISDYGGHEQNVCFNRQCRAVCPSRDCSINNSELEPGAFHANVCLCGNTLATPDNPFCDDSTSIVAPTKQDCLDMRAAQGGCLPKGHECCQYGCADWNTNPNYDYTHPVTGELMEPGEYVPETLDGSPTGCFGIEACCDVCFQPATDCCTFADECEAASRLPLGTSHNFGCASSLIPCAGTCNVTLLPCITSDEVPPPPIPIDNNPSTCWCQGSRRPGIDLGGCCSGPEGTNLYTPHFITTCPYFPPTGFVSGKVSNSETAAGVSNAKLIVFHPNSGTQIFGVSNDPSDGDYRIELPAPETGSIIYEIYADAYGYNKSITKSVTVAKDITTVTDFQIDPLIIVCSIFNPGPVDNATASHIAGVKAVRLEWNDGCPGLDTAGYRIERIGPGSVVELDTFTTKTSYVDDGVMWGTAYTYRIYQKYIEPDAESDYVEILFTTGNELCENKLWSRAEKPGYSDEFCWQNERQSCDSENQLDQLGVDADRGVLNCNDISSEDNIFQCVVVPDGYTECRLIGQCSMFLQLADPFGLFYTKEKCLDPETFCYYDYSLTTVDACYECIQDDQPVDCYDYRSESACTLDTCSASVGDNYDGKLESQDNYALNCGWISTSFGELGAGYCYKPGYNDSDQCGRCLNTNYPFSNVECTAEICDSLGACFATDEGCGGCTDENQMECEGFGNENDCIGVDPLQNITIEGATKSLTESNDACHLGTCKWLNNECIKDGNDDNIEDCEGDGNRGLSEVQSRPCKKDNIPPSTEILNYDFIATNPIGAVGTDLVIYSRNLSDPDPTKEIRDLYFVSYCLSDNETECLGYTTASKRSGSSFITVSNMTINPVLGYTLTEPKIYYFKFYGIDQHYNQEPVNTVSFFIDPVYPEINLTINIIEDKDFNTATGDYPQSDLQILIDSVLPGDFVTCTDTLKNESNVWVSEELSLNPKNISWIINSYTGLADGHYDYSLNCSDDAGNMVELGEHIYIDVFSFVDMKYPPLGAITPTVFDFEFTTDADSTCYWLTSGGAVFNFSELEGGETGGTEHKFSSFQTGIFALQPNTYYPFGSTGSIKCYDIFTGSNDTVVPWFTVDNTPPITTMSIDSMAYMPWDLGDALYFEDGKTILLDCTDQVLNDSQNLFTTPRAPLDMIFGCNDSRIKYSFDTSFQDILENDVAESELFVIGFYESVAGTGIQINNSGKFCYRSEDNGGNFESHNCINIFIDAEPPEVDIVTPAYQAIYDGEKRYVTDIPDGIIEVSVKENEPQNADIIIVTHENQTNETQLFNRTPFLIDPLLNTRDYTLYRGVNLFKAAAVEKSGVFAIDKLYVYYDQVGPEVYEPLIREDDDLNKTVGLEISHVEYGHTFSITGLVDDVEYTFMVGQNNQLDINMYSPDSVVNLADVASASCDYTDVDSGLCILQGAQAVHSDVMQEIPGTNGTQFFLDYIGVVSYGAVGNYSLAPGIYTLLFDARDMLNNLNKEAYQFEVRDTVQPTFEINMFYDDGTPVPEGVDLSWGTYGVLIRASEPLDDFIPILSYSWDAGAASGNSWDAGSDSVLILQRIDSNNYNGTLNIFGPTYEGIDGALATFAMEAYDQHGNIAGSLTGATNFTIDTAGPAAPSIEHPEPFGEFIYTNEQRFLVSGFAAAHEPNANIVLKMINFSYTTQLGFKQEDYGIGPNPSPVWNSILYNFSNPNEPQKIVAAGQQIEEFTRRKRDTWFVSGEHPAFTPDAWISFSKCNTSDKRLYDITNVIGYLPAGATTQRPNVSVEPSIDCDLELGDLIYLYDTQTPLGWYGVDLELSDNGQLLPEGNYVVYVNAIDENGIQGQVDKKIVVFDQQTPTADEYPVNGTITAEQIDEVKIVFNDEVGPAVSGIRTDVIWMKITSTVQGETNTIVLAADDLAVPADTTATGEIAYQPSEVLPYGDYDVQVYFEDMAGNAVLKTWNFRTTDQVTHPPIITATPGIAPYNNGTIVQTLTVDDYIITNSPTPTVDIVFVKEKNDVDNLINVTLLRDSVTGETYHDDAEFQRVDDYSFQLSKTLAEGVHEFTINARKQKSDTEWWPQSQYTFYIVVDTTDPEIEFQHLRAANSIFFYLAKGFYNEANIKEVGITGDIADEQPLIAGNVSDALTEPDYHGFGAAMELSVIEDTGNTAQITATAYDKAGHSAGVSGTITIDLIPPTATIDSINPTLDLVDDIYYTAQDSISILGTANDNFGLDYINVTSVDSEGEVVDVQLYQLPEDPLQKSASYSQSIALEEGLNTIYVTAFDDASNRGASDPGFITVKKDTTAPELAEPPILNRTAIGIVYDTSITLHTSELLKNVIITLQGNSYNIDDATSVEELDDGTVLYTFTYRWSQPNVQGNQDVDILLIDMMDNSALYETSLPVDTKPPSIVEYDDYVVTNVSPVRINMKFDEPVMCRSSFEDVAYEDMEFIDMSFIDEFEIAGYFDTSKKYEEKKRYFQCIDEAENLMPHSLVSTYVFDRLSPNLTFSSFGEYKYYDGTYHYNDEPIVYIAGRTEEGVRLTIYKFGSSETSTYNITEVVDETIIIDGGGQFDRASITVGKGSTLTFVSAEAGDTYHTLLTSNYPDFVSGQNKITIRDIGDYYFRVAPPINSQIDVIVKENEGFFNVPYELAPDTALNLYFLAADAMGNRNETYYWNKNFYFPAVYDSMPPFVIPSIQPGSVIADKQKEIRLTFEDGIYGSGVNFSTLEFSLTTTNPNEDPSYTVTCGAIACSCKIDMPGVGETGCSGGPVTFEDSTFIFTPYQDIIASDREEVTVLVSAKDNVGHAMLQEITYTIDTNAPEDPIVTIEKGVEKDDGIVYTSNNNPGIEVEYTLPVDVTMMDIDGVSLLGSEQSADNLSFTYSTPLLVDREYAITLNATRLDSDKFSYKPNYQSFIVDTIPPLVNVTNQDTKTPDQQYLIMGYCVDDNIDFVLIDSQQVECGLLAENQYGYEVTLDEGINTITIEAFDKAGNSASVEYEIELDLTAPGIPVIWRAPSATINPTITLVGFVPGQDQARILASVQQVAQQVAQARQFDTQGLGKSNVIDSSFVTEELGYNYRVGSEFGIYDKDNLKYSQAYALFAGHNFTHFERYKVTGTKKFTNIWVNVIDFLISIFGSETQIGYSEIGLDRTFHKPITPGEKVEFYDSPYPDSWFSIDIELFEGSNDVFILAQNDIGAYSQPRHIQILYDPDLAMTITQVYPTPGTIDIGNTEFVSKGSSVPIEVETSLEAECSIKHIADGTAREFDLPMETTDGLIHTFSVDESRCFTGTEGQYTEIAGEENWHNYLVTCDPIGTGMVSANAQVCFSMKTFVTGSVFGGAAQASGTPDLCDSESIFGAPLTGCPKIFCDALYSDYDSCTASGTGCTWCGVGTAGKCVNSCSGSTCPGKAYNNDEDDTRCDSVGPCPSCSDYNFDCLCSSDCLNWGNNKGQCGGLLNCQAQFTYGDCSVDPSRGRCKNCPSETNCLRNCADCSNNVYNNDADPATCDNLQICDSCYPTTTPCKCPGSCFRAGDLTGNCGGEAPTDPTGVCFQIGDNVVC